LSFNIKLNINQNQGIFTVEQLNQLKKSSLAKVICENGDNITRITGDVFVVPQRQSWINCKDIPSIDLNQWKENTNSVNACN
jgi:peroxidase